MRVPAGSGEPPPPARVVRRLRRLVTRVQRIHAGRAEERDRLGVTLPPAAVQRASRAAPLGFAVDGRRESGLWALRVPLEHLGARVYPDMFSLAQAHNALADDGRIANEQLQERFENNIANFMDLVEAATHYPCVKRAWVEFLGEQPDPSSTASSRPPAAWTILYLTRSAQDLPRSFLSFVMKYLKL